MIGEVIEALVRYAQSNLTKESAAAEMQVLFPLNRRHIIKGENIHKDTLADGKIL